MRVELRAEQGPALGIELRRKTLQALVDEPRNFAEIEKRAEPIYGDDFDFAHLTSMGRRRRAYCMYPEVRGPADFG